MPVFGGSPSRTAWQDNITRKKQKQLKDSLGRPKKRPAAHEPGSDDDMPEAPTKKPKTKPAGKGAVNKPKPKSKAKANSKPSSAEKATPKAKVARSNSGLTPDKPTPKNKAKARSKSGLAEKPKSTFARRYQPNTKDGSKWWCALSKVFNEAIKDSVTRPSSLEDKRGCQTFPPHI